MAIEIKRKIIRVGDSDAVTIPPGFKKFHKICKGMEVDVLVDNVILIIPPGLDIEKYKQKIYNE